MEGSWGWAWALAGPCRPFTHSLTQHFRKSSWFPYSPQCPSCRAPARTDQMRHLPQGSWSPLSPSLLSALSPAPLLTRLGADTPFASSCSDTLRTSRWRLG